MTDKGTAMDVLLLDPISTTGGRELMIMTITVRGRRSSLVGNLEAPTSIGWTNSGRRDAPFDRRSLEDDTDTASFQ